MLRSTILASIMLASLFALSAHALIMVGGKEPVTDHNWPAGSLDVANHKARLSYLEGPPFGGGEYTFQYRGDTATFNDILSRFVQIKAPDLLLVIHDGPGSNPVATREEKNKADSRVDFSFTVWTPENFYHLYANSTSFFAVDRPEFRSEVSPPRLDVWSNERGVNLEQMQIPPGVRILDERAISHGYKAEDQSVITGVAYDMLSSKPVGAVELVMEKHDTAAPADAGWVYKVVGTAVADADGRFELKKLDAGQYHASLRCTGYASRSLGYVDLGAGTFKSFTIRMSPAIEQTGRIVDNAGQPLAKVAVRIDSRIAVDGRGYPQPESPKVLTDADGRFTLTDLPRGQAQITARADHHYQVDSLKPHAIPAEPLTIVMTGTGSIHAKVVDRKGNPVAGNISVWPEGGSKVGSWGGGANTKDDGTFTFENVPPGKYFISADPSDQYRKGGGGTLIEVKPGEEVGVELKKK